MIFSAKIEFRDYLKLMYRLSYKYLFTKYVTLMGIIAFFYSLLSFVGIFAITPTTYVQFLIGSSVVIASPLMVYRTAKKNFYSNKVLQENTEFVFKDNILVLKGESFYSELDLTKSNKIEEINGWFLIYQSRQSANFIITKNLTVNQIKELRFILKKVPNVPKMLK